MNTAKLFANGKSQAVRLPKEYRFDGNEVYIKRIGEAIVLFPKDRAWDLFLSGLAGFTDDFMKMERQQGADSERDAL
jgi:antitoxin VapB